MLKPSRALAFGMLTALACAIAPAQPVEPAARAGQNFDKGWSAASGTREAASGGGDFDLSWFTVDGGGGTSTGGGFNVSGGFQAGAAPPPAAGCASTCADINGSGGNVDLVDFATFAVCFGQLPSSSTACACSDLNQDGAVNLLDFATFSLIFSAMSTNTIPNCP